MTPAAFALAKRMLDVKNTSKDERQKIRDLLDGAHFFDVTGIATLAADLLEKLDEDWSKFEPLRDFVFLPAPKTWLEMKEGNRRWVFVLVGTQYHVWLFDMSEPDPYAVLKSRPIDELRVGARDWVENTINCMLIMINTPRIIGRKQHMPHRGLERDLLKNQKLVGKFPLRAWTEIKLEVSKPPEIDDGEPHEAHLTGERCLHFCRAHLRIWCRQLIFVASHWRGNPALGIKQSRYVTT